MPLTRADLSQLVADHAAVRRARRLQPIDGPGGKIFPSTYPGADKNQPPRHATEMRRVSGQNVPCVLIDSVQSAANRLEDALSQAVTSGRVFVPHIQVDFANVPGLHDVGVITDLGAPHRVFDAILRDSETETGAPFRKSPEGEAVLRASTREASAILTLSPVSLLMGAWNSTGDGGGLGAKFPRAVVAEIVGYGWEAGNRTASRIDPLGARAAVPLQGPKSDWRVLAAGTKMPKGASTLKPSEVNHGNIAPSIGALGGTLDYALHTFTLSFASLRRISFGGSSNEIRARRDGAARSVLAALALVALLEGDRAGYALRSRCDLVLDPTAPHHQQGVLEVVHFDGTTAPFTLTSAEAIALYRECVEDVIAAGLPWATSPFMLKPQPRLVELVQASRALALSDVADGESE
jgi:CRISPR-associated protein Csb1